MKLRLWFPIQCSYIQAACTNALGAFRWKKHETKSLGALRVKPLKHPIQWIFPCRRREDPRVGLNQTITHPVDSNRSLADDDRTPRVKLLSIELAVAIINSTTFSLEGKFNPNGQLSRLITFEKFGHGDQTGNALCNFARHDREIIFDFHGSSWVGARQDGQD